MTMPGTKLAENFLGVAQGGIFQAGPPLAGNCPIRVLQSNHKIEQKFKGGASVVTRAKEVATAWGGSSQIINKCDVPVLLGQLVMGHEELLRQKICK